MRPSSPRIVILPGLDGTGLLLRDFAEALGPFFPVDIVTYPGDVALGYDDLLDHARACLPSEDHILIGESFSGPLALRIAQARPPGLRAVVLGASFARVDLPFKAVLSRMADAMPVGAVPATVVGPLLMGWRVGSVRRGRLRDAMSRVEPRVLKRRLREALAVDLVRAGVAVAQPVLYLRATEDRLISARAADVVAGIAAKTSIRDVRAPHFLFQAAPDECARAIVAFHERIMRESRRTEPGPRPDMDGA